jgi:hypothetical protein
MNVLILVAVWSKVFIVLYCLKTVIIVLDGASELFVFPQFLGVVQWLAVNKCQPGNTQSYSFDAPHC